MKMCTKDTECNFQGPELECTKKECVYDNSEKTKEQLRDDYRELQKDAKKNIQSFKIDKVERSKG